MLLLSFCDAKIWCTICAILHRWPFKSIFFFYCRVTVGGDRFYYMVNRLYVCSAMHFLTTSRLLPSSVLNWYWVQFRCRLNWRSVCVWYCSSSPSMFSFWKKLGIINTFFFSYYFKKVTPRNKICYKTYSNISAHISTDFCMCTKASAAAPLISN